MFFKRESCKIWNEHDENVKIEWTWWTNIVDRKSSRMLKTQTIKHKIMKIITVKACQVTDTTKQNNYFSSYVW